MYVRREASGQQGERAGRWQAAGGGREAADKRVGGRGRALRLIIIIIYYYDYVYIYTYI